MVGLLKKEKVVDHLLLEESRTANTKKRNEKVVVSESHMCEQQEKSSRTTSLMGYGIYCMQFWAPQ